MNLNRLARLSLARRKAKAAFVLAGLILGVSTVVCLVTLTRGLTADVNHKLEKYGANILIRPKTDSLNLGYEGLSLGGLSLEAHQLKLADLAGISKIENAANVAAVGPMLLGGVDIQGRRALLAGVDFDASRTLKPWWRISGQYPQADGLVLGSKAARLLGLGVGEEARLNGETFPVSGVLAPTGSQDDRLIFAPLSLAQRLLNMPGLVSMAEVAALCTDCPVDKMVQQIGAILPGAEVTAISQVVKGRMAAISSLERIGLGLSLAVILAGGLVVLVTMTGSVRERTGEIGIYRAIGWRRRHIVRLILTEAATVSAMSGLAGYFLGLAAAWLLLPLFSGGSAASAVGNLWNPWLALGSLGLALLLGLVSAVHPALMAARLDPNLALRAL